jgi:hypothetical protein
MSYRTTARVAGALFIAATAAGLSAIPLWQPVIDADDPLIQASLSASRVATGALLVLIMGIAVVAIPIAIYPVLRQFSERLALGYVVARTIEGVTNVIFALTGLTLAALGQELAGAATPSGSHETIGSLLLAVHDGILYEVLPIVFGLSALILNYALYSARLVPRWLSAWGFIGGALFLLSGVLAAYGLDRSWTTNVFAPPIGLQEMAFAAWLIVRGFNPAVFPSLPEQGAVRGRAPVAATGTT